MEKSQSTSGGAPPVRYRVNSVTGEWEQWMVEPKKATGDQTPPRKFEVVVNQGKYILQETPTRQRSFDTDDALVQFCRRTTKSGLIEYYGPPSSADLIAGDNKGTFINSESW